MVQYPYGVKKSHAKATQSNTRGRGMTLESDINQSNETYRIQNKAVIHKKPTPIQVVHVDYPARNKARITEAYYRQASTTDYNGVYNGFAIDFEAKETQNKTLFPLALLHQHQIEHLKAVHRQGALAFLIIRFTVLEETYLVFAHHVINYIETQDSRSLTLKWIRDYGALIQQTYQAPCDYLPVLEQYVKETYEKFK